MGVLKNEMGNAKYLVPLGGLTPSRPCPVHLEILMEFFSSGPFGFNGSENARIEKRNGKYNNFGATGGVDPLFGHAQSILGH